MASKFRSAFLPGGWLGGEVDDLKKNNRTIVTTLKSLFVQEASTREESFEQAMVRLNLTDQDVKKIESNYHWYALFFFMLGILLFLYGFYLLFEHTTFTGWMLATAASIFSLSYAFRYDFWAYQMKVKKLGVSFKEWKNNFLGSKGTPT